MSKFHAAYRRETASSFPHPDDDKSWEAETDRELRAPAFGPQWGAVNVVDVAVVGSLPPLEVPPCLTLQQWLDIMSNGA